MGGAGKAEGNFLQLEGDIGNSAQIDRDQGLKNTVYKEPGIKVLESLTGKWLREEAMRITDAVGEQEAVKTFRGIQQNMKEIKEQVDDFKDALKK